MKRKVRGSKCFKTFVIGATKNYPSTNVLYTLLQTTIQKYTCFSSKNQESKTGCKTSFIFLIAEDNIFAPSKGAWFTMMEEAFRGVHLDLNSTRSNFSKNAFFST